MPRTVSVVIPCYNQGRFLTESIQSALSQTHPAMDVVVVDDGSVDDTAAVAARYPTVRCISQPNRGLSAARNAGLRAVRGAFVVFLDADDRLLPCAAATGLASLERAPTAAFAVGLERHIDTAGAPLPVRRRSALEADAYASLVRRCWIMPPGAVMFRCSMLEAIGGFDPALRCAEDYDVYLKLARRHSIIDHYTEVVEYRQHPGTLSRRAEHMLAATIGVLRPHRPDRHASAEHHAAWRARDNVAWYVERLLDQIVADARSSRWRSAMRGAAVLVHHVPDHPRYVARRLTTPLRRALSRVAS
jgi:glycosyltransferase involved in cell wall biosynthesis